MLEYFTMQSLVQRDWSIAPRFYGCRAVACGADF
jgi:hypothetical protein